MANVLGDVSPVCIAITGMSERELPKDDYSILAIEGPCSGGYDVEHTELGYVSLCRGYGGAEKERCNWRRQHLLLPFAKNMR